MENFIFVEREFQKENLIFVMIHLVNHSKHALILKVEKQHIDKRTLAIHILCWGFLVFVPSILRPSDSFDERIFHTLRSLGPSLCYMAVFYLN